jgi:hypothetical protein
MEVRAVIIRDATNPAYGYFMRITGMFALMHLPHAQDEKATPPLPPALCDHCRIPAAFKAEFLDVKLGRQVRVHQCTNCAKVIWEGE